MKCKKCGAKLEIDFDGIDVIYPVFSCPEHGVEKNEWKEWWEKYSELGLKKECWHNKKDRPSCVVSYFCHIFLKHYGKAFTLDTSNPCPYKNKDFTMARRVLSMFGEDYLQIPNYIKWVFKHKLKGRKYPLKSIGFLTSALMINEYKLQRARQEKPKRSSNIPSDFIQWCEQNYPQVIEYHQVKTLNDLNVLIALAERGPEGRVVEEARNRGIVPQQGYIQLEE